MANAEDAASEMDETRREFEELVMVLANWGDPNWVTEVIVSGTAPNQALRYKTFCTPAASSGALIVEIRNTCP